LPTRYNDGTPVEAERIDLVLEELGDRFGTLLSILNSFVAPGFITASGLRRTM